MILSGQKLVLELKKAFDHAKTRIWIAVPFIGVWESVQCITGINWRTKRNIDIRLITDIRNENFISKNTYEIFKENADLRTLDGLHAKIYIIDDYVLLTSANLTGTAFSKRYEIGIMLNNNQEVIKTFEDWWIIAKQIDDYWLPSKRANKNSNDEPEDSNTQGLKKLWNLPQKPIIKSTFNNYQSNIVIYNKFTNIYEENGERLLVQLPIYQEVDSFFNYLFHKHPQKPSSEYIKPKTKYRQLTDIERIEQFKIYFKQYKDWLIKNPNFEDDRLKSLQVIKEKLSLSNIDSINNFKDVKDIVNRFYCMNSFQLNLSKFLNPDNNNIIDIKNEWKSLLHDVDINLEVRMNSCKNKLYSFGKSSINELLAWYYPDDYPMINRNSNSGMKFFGYDIKTY